MVYDTILSAQTLQAPVLAQTAMKPSYYRELMQLSDVSRRYIMQATHLQADIEEVLTLIIVKVANERARQRLLVLRSGIGDFKMQFSCHS